MANHAAADQSPTDPTGCHRPIWLQLPGAALGVLAMALFAMGWQHL